MPSRAVGGKYGIDYQALCRHQRNHREGNPQHLVAAVKAELVKQEPGDQGLQTIQQLVVEDPGDKAQDPPARVDGPVQAMRSAADDLVWVRNLAREQIEAALAGDKPSPGLAIAWTKELRQSSEVFLRIGIDLKKDAENKLRDVSPELDEKIRSITGEPRQPEFFQIAGGDQ